MPSKLTLYPRLDTPIGNLYREIQGKLMHMNSPDNLYTLCGAVAANMLTGPPLWLMFIGPPGCGKTELLTTVSAIPGIQFVHAITSDAAYLSGSPRASSSKGTGGLLRQVGGHGMLISDDMTRIMNMPPFIRDNIQSADRDIFSGQYTRTLGVDGGRVLTWEGKIGRLGGVTNSIDLHHQVSAELGERWINSRWPPPIDWYEAARFVMANSHKPGRKAQLAELVAKLFTDCGLAFGLQTPPERVLDWIEEGRLVQIAQLGCQCRTAVTRDMRTTEIESHMDSQEAPNRMTGALRQLFLGMDHIGVPDDSKWRIVSKCALDSMSQIRQDVVVEAWSNPGGIGYEDLKKISGMSISTIKRVVDDMEHLQVIRKAIGEDNKTTVVLLREEIRKTLNNYCKELKEKQEGMRIA